MANRMLAQSPQGWRVIAAFAAGAVIAVAAAVQVVPRAERLATGLPGDLGIGGEEGEILPGEAGGQSVEEYVVDPTTGKLVRRRTTGGASASGGSRTAGTSGTAGRAAGKTGAGATVGGGGSGGGTGSGGGPLECRAGRNGGSTDVGVTGNQIRLAATVVKSDIGRAFLGDVEFGMQAVLNKVNRAGGICGRQLSLKLVDDGWNASRGQQFIRSFIQEGYFALPVVPSSEGLRLAGESGDIDRAGIPVVGTDGMLIHQYTDPWIWPVAASTISTMHIMAKNAHDRGARTFGIVWENTYRFGVEGASAFRGALGRLSGSQLLADVPIQAGQSSYKNQVNDFNSRCGECDFVALLLEPQTATVWIRDGGYLGNRGKAIGAGGAQPLFGDNFAGDFAAVCPAPCNTQFWVWTGFKPPIPPYDTDPAVSTYVGDMKATNSSADRVNQFVEGGYDGMLLLVESLKKVGPNLTRAGLRELLDGMDFDSGLSTVKSWRPGNHFANIRMQAFSIVLNAGSFAGWRYQNTGWIEDPWPGQDVPR